MQIARPIRASHTYTQQLVAPPDEVFPLLCPVRECDWVNGWDPKVVYSDSGIAELDCVFVMPGEAEDAIWVVTRYEPESYRIGFVKVTPGETVGHIEIALAADGGDATKAEITYMFTALGEKGEPAVREFTEDAYREFMQAWERELNHYLETGEKIAPEAVEAS